MIEVATKKDLEQLTNLACKLYESSAEQIRQEFENILSNSNAVCYVWWNECKVVAFAQCQLRFDYVEGTSSSPVGYLEGVFVEEKFRNQNIAKQLTKKCEQWAKNKGAKEFASDCEITNHTSFAFHKSIGFEETNRIICFKKDL